MAGDDADVVRRVVAGQVNDFRVLVERHQDAVFRFVRGLVGHRHEAEDITQDVFVAAYRNLAGFQPDRATFSTWLLTIARNRAINHLRRRRNTATQSLPDISDAQQPAVAVDEREFLEQLERALNSLPVEQKTVFVLAEIEQLPQAEIAEIERTSLGTVKSRLHRAKRRLRAALQALVRAS